MKLTNKLGLPDVFMDICADDDYDKGEADFSTTELISPPWLRMLQRRHFDEIEEDISNMFWSLSGNAKHYILEKAARRNPERYIAEKRYYIDVDGYKIGGKLDLFDKWEERLWDYKETSVWKLSFGDFSDWTAQASINRYILSQNGIHPKHTSNVAMLRDWKKREAKCKKDYPQSAMVPVKIYPMNDADTLSYIKGRVKVHADALERGIATLCTAKERWLRNEAWAIKKKGVKNAIRGGVHKTEEDARKHLATLPAGHSIEYRPGEQVRCEGYCNVAQFCSFWKQWLNKTTETEETESP